MTDEPTENWNWSKFFGGFFNGLNTAKAITTTFHQILIALIVGAVIFLGISAYKHFKKPKSTVQPPIEVTTNNGRIETRSDDRRKNCWLLNFCW